MDQAHGHASSQVPAGLSSLASSAKGHRARGRTRESQWPESGEEEEEGGGGGEGGENGDDGGDDVSSAEELVSSLADSLFLAEAAKPLWCEW